MEQIARIRITSLSKAYDTKYLGLDATKPAFEVSDQTTKVQASLRPQDKSASLKIIFLISQPNICCGYSKEPPR